MFCVKRLTENNYVKKFVEWSVVFFRYHLFIKGFLIVFRIELEFIQMKVITVWYVSKLDLYRIVNANV